MRVRSSLTLAVLMLGMVGTASGQALPPQAERGPVLEQRVRDLLDYREYLETQIAASKVLVAEQTRLREAAEAALKACQTPPVAPATRPK